VKGVDQVFHLAGATTAVKEKTYFEVNTLGTGNLIQACIEHNTGLKKFIFLSSQAAAGPCRSGGRKKESDPCEPVSPYGKSKLLGEKSALFHSREMPLLILRPSAVYGPRDKGFHALFKCLSRHIKPCLCDPDQHISLCYVQDLVRGILLAAETPTASGEIFFLSDGRDYRMSEMGDTFARAMKISALPLRLPKQVLFCLAFLAQGFSRVSGKPLIMSSGKVAEMIQKNWCCDIAKARAFLGFEPRIFLPRGAELAVAWYKKENWL
jgi:nucleoside-diphosphate-sugar epimerase